MPSTETPSRRNDRRWLKRLVIVAGASLGLTTAALLATLLFGLIGGEEFCPDSFSRRSFHYYEVPLLGLQISPLNRDDQSSDLERYLVQRGYVTPVTGGPATWHLVYGTRSGVVNSRGDAAILCTYLDARDEDHNLVWKAWTEQHAAAAKVLWPLVAQVARRQLYLFVPELFDLARHATTPDALDRQLRTALARQYRQLAAIQQQLGDVRTAAELLEQALVLAPGDETLRQRRAALPAP